MVEDNAHLTPEKQLLKLIEEPHTGTGRKTSGKGLHLSGFSLGAFRGRLDFLKLQARSFINSWSGPLDVKKVNFFLTVLAAATGIYALASFVVLSLKMSAPPAFSSKEENMPGAGTLKLPSALKPLSFYQEKVQARDIFRIGGQPAQQAPQQDNTAKQMEEFQKKYKLVGISWSDNPDAMIENSAEQKTYFLKRGQMLEGMRIEAIFKDKVVVSYNGQEIELR